MLSGLSKGLALRNHRQQSQISGGRSRTQSLRFPQSHCGAIALASLHIFGTVVRGKGTTYNRGLHMGSPFIFNGFSLDFPTSSKAKLAPQPAFAGFRKSIQFVVFLVFSRKYSFFEKSR